MAHAHDSINNEHSNQYQEFFFQRSGCTSHAFYVALRRIVNIMEPDKLLIVDDNENNLFTFAQILETPNRELTCVSSGKDALAALVRERFSLVLMDVQMPGMDGFKTAKIMASMSEEPSIPIIFISATYKTPEFIEQGFDLGAFDYITKPVDAYLLQSKVKAFLRMVRQEKG